MKKAGQSIFADYLPCHNLQDYGIVHQSVLHVILRMGEGGDKSPDPCMGIAAGGTIAQRIYEDRHDPRIYDYVRGVRFYVHAINAAMWR